MESNTGGASAQKLCTHLVMASRHPAARCRPVATGLTVACGLQGDERAPKVSSARASGGGGSGGGAGRAPRAARWLPVCGHQAPPLCDRCLEAGVAPSYSLEPSKCFRPPPLKTRRRPAASPASGHPWEAINGAEQDGHAL